MHDGQQLLLARPSESMCNYVRACAGQELLKGLCSYVVLERTCIPQGDSLGSRSCQQDSAIHARITPDLVWSCLQGVVGG